MQIRGVRVTEISKLYYSITDVSRLTGEEPHILRYWEREFTQLKPEKNRAGNRVYTLRDLSIVKAIQKLLREERLSVPKAKAKLVSFAIETEGFYPELDSPSSQTVSLSRESTQELIGLLREIADVLSK